MRRFTRLTNAFNKRIEIHAHMAALHVAYYHFCKVHESLRDSAMEAGLAATPWDLKLDDYQARVGRSSAACLEPRQIAVSRRCYGVMRVGCSDQPGVRPRNINASASACSTGGENR